MPVPSVHLEPARRFLQLVALLQPHLATELAPELARQLLAQASAPTMQAAATQPDHLPKPSGAGRGADGSVGGSFSGPPQLRQDGGAAPTSESFSVAGAASPASALLATRSVGVAGLCASSLGGVPGVAASAAVATVPGAFGGWLWSHVIQDDRSLGVGFDPARRAFHCSRPGSRLGVAAQLEQAATVRELSLVVEVSRAPLPDAV